MTTIQSVIANCNDKQRIVEAIKDLSGTVKQDKNDYKTFIAPGPAEAWAWLYAHVDVPGAVYKDPRAKNRAVYRGQSCAHWGLSPTFLRLRDTDRPAAKKAAIHFADIVQVEFEILGEGTSGPWPPWDKRSGEVAAQHFGMHTSLLDWSSSYSTAIDFATQKADGEMCAVWWFYLAEAEKTNLKLVLPPPYVHRLYLQRGLFTEIINEQNVNVLQDVACKIVFPALQHEKAKVVVGKEIKELLTLEPSDPWFIALRDYCNSEAGRRAFDSYPTKVERSLRFDAYLLALDNKPSKRWQNELNNAGLGFWFGEEGMLYQIPEFILSIAKRTKLNDGKIGFDADVIRILREENPGIIDWALPFMDEIIKKQRNSIWEGDHNMA